MAAAASEQEQGKEVEIVPPADPDPKQQQQQEGRDAMAHPDSGKKHSASVEVAAKTKELLSEAQALHLRISQLLGPAGPHRVVSTSDIRWRCLAFMETELRFIAAFLTTLKFNPQLFARDKWGWVKDCLGAVKFIDLHRRNSEGNYIMMIRWLYRISEHLRRYKHLPVTSSALVLTPQLVPLVGIDRPPKKILRWLARQGKRDRNLKVMSIVGPVGIGKTTLAVDLYNRLRHETTGGRYYFQCNVMAQMSRATDRNTLLLQDILSQVSEQATTELSSDLSEVNTVEVLVQLVSESLLDKRYFIIIDDIWVASDWKEIKGAFPNNNHGSRILIMTRVKTIALKCCSDCSHGLVHQMNPLSETDSERLLLAKAVGSEDGCLPNNMKLLCDEILRRCDGIPLSITCMADWLKEQGLQQQHQGEEDEDKEYQGFPIFCEHHWLPQGLEQALSTAFDEFPDDDLRVLSLYMSMFPYGYKFYKDRLIWKWRQGSVSRSEAETYFSQLVDRNIITSVASKCENNLDEAETGQWQVNHFVHQFLASKSAEMGFVFTTTTLNLLAASSSSRIPRRLALHQPDPLLPSLLETLDLSQTRSLSVSGTVIGIPLDKFLNLVVLDMEGWENLKEEDLLQVCRSKMLFLRYLSIRNTRVSKLPHEIKELQSLLSLDVSYTQISQLPLEAFELTRLMRLDLRGTRISQLPKQLVGLRDGLSDLLVGGEGTINSVETLTRLPQDVRHIRWLRTLATVDLTEQPPSFVRALGDLQELWVLAVTWSSIQSTDTDCCKALLSSIAKWENLESLTIQCVLGCSMEFLGSLETSRAPRWLNKFKVTAGRFASVPRWLKGLELLAFVQITVCKQEVDDLKILGELATLQCLILGLDFIPEQPIVIENKWFKWLDRFSVDCPTPWVTFETGAMPRLAHLLLNFSSGPTSEEQRVPSGITNLPRISKVVLSYSKWCTNSTTVNMTVKAVREQVAQHCNPINLFINGTEDDVVQAVDDETENATGTASGTDAGPRRDYEYAATRVIQIEITEAESSSKAMISSQSQQKE